MKNALVRTLVLVALISGCSDKNKGVAISSPDRATDFTLLDIALADFAGRDAFDSHAFSGDVIVIQRSTRFPTATLDERRLISGRRTESLSAELVESLRQRNDGAISIADFKPSTPNVVVDDLSASIATRRIQTIRALREKQPNARGFVHTWRPGYNSTGTEAVLRFRLGPSRMGKGAVATYRFQKQGEDWTILWQIFTTSRLPEDR
ncbi:MAG: hypothetical protein ACYTHJ_19255 [Planctomycetota bacterium]|jgi:hypothetical protein